MRLKSVLLLFMILTVTMPLFSQSMSEDSLRVLVKKELKDYEFLMSQISRLSGIISKRAEVRKLYAAGDAAGIILGFENEEKQIGEALKTKDNDAADDRLQDLKIIYKGVPVVQDRILFYKALLSFTKKNFNESQVALEEIVNNYPLSVKRSQAVYLLEKLYITSGQDDKLIALEEKNPQMKSTDQTFWLAQAYYNLGQFDKAFEVFENLKTDKAYNLRAQAMQALIVANLGSPEEALVQFRQLKDTFKLDDPYYDFVMLCLARLYAHTGDLNEALNYYTIYSKLNSGLYTSEIKYEMAIAMKNLKQYDKAEALFRQVLKDPKATEYYPSVIYLLVYMKGVQGQQEDARILVDESKRANAEYMKLLVEKSEALDQLRDLSERFLHAEGKDARIQMIDEMSRIEKRMSDIDVQLLSFSTGIDQDEVKKLRDIEDKYVTFHNLVTQEIIKLKLLESKPNDDVKRVIDLNIALLDSTYVKALAYNFLANLPEVSYTRYQNAELLAQEIWAQRNTISVWKQVAQRAEKTGNSQLAVKANGVVAMLEENLAGLEMAADHYFGNYGSNPEREAEVQKVLDDILQTRNDLYTIRNDAAENFNRKLSLSMLKKTAEKVQKYDEVFKLYSKQFTKLNDKMNVLNKQFDYTLLELQFINTVTNDKLLQQQSESTDKSTGQGGR